MKVQWQTALLLSACAVGLPIFTHDKTDGTATCASLLEGTKAYSLMQTRQQRLKSIREQPDSESSAEEDTTEEKDGVLPSPDSTITLDTGPGGCSGTTTAKLDLYESGASTDTTLLVIPGGAYMKISTVAIGSVVPEYLQAGYRVAVLHYRVPRSATKPWILCADPKQALADATAAFNSLLNDAGTGSIVMVGFSAGGHLAAHYSTTCSGHACPAGVLLHFPWLETGAKVACGESGKAYANDPLSPTDGSQGCFPTTLVTPTTPPTIVYHASGDTTSLVAWSVTYVEALELAGVKHAYYEVPGGGHYLGSFSDVVAVSDGAFSSNATWASLAGAVLSLSSDACTVCDDYATPYMNRVGKTCAESRGTIKQLCNKKASWITKGYCRQTCANAGLGYIGESCCPTGCKKCTNQPTKYMIDRGLTCETWRSYVETACQSSSWQDSGQYCRKICDGLGHAVSGYSPCC